MAGPIADSLGVKKAIVLMEAFVIAGAILDCTSQNGGMLLFARFVMGVGVGGEQNVVPR